MKKSLIVAIIILVAVAIGLFFWLQYSFYSPLQEQEQKQQPAAQTSPPASAQPSDTAASISRDVDAVDLGDLDKEFDQVDQDLQGL